MPNHDSPCEELRQVSHQEKEVIELQGRVSNVENELTDLRTYMDQRFESGTRRMDEMSADIKGLTGKITDLVQAVMTTNLELSNHMQIEQKEQAAITKSLHNIELSMSPLSKFVTGLGERDIKETRKSLDAMDLVRDYGKKATYVAIASAVAGVIWLIQNNGGK